MDERRCLSLGCESVLAIHVKVITVRTHYTLADHKGGDHLGQAMKADNISGLDLIGVCLTLDLSSLDPPGDRTMSFGTYSVTKRCELNSDKLQKYEIDECP